MKKRCLLLILLIFVITSSKVYGADETEKAGDVREVSTAERDTIGVPSPINFPKAAKLLKSTGIIIVIIVVTVYLLRKKLGINTSLNKKRRYVHIVDTVSLGSKKHVHLIKLPGKLLLVGATNERIQALAEITEKEVVESVDTEMSSSEFMRFFKRTYKNE